MKKIVWNESRRLKQIDFKGSIANRPFEAATSSYFGYEYSGRLINGKVKFEVTTQFDCERLYFKGTYQIDSVLAHEQGHFDLTELYARKFFKKITEEIKNIKDLEGSINMIYDDITKELIHSRWNTPKLTILRIVRTSENPYVNDIALTQDALT